MLLETVEEYLGAVYRLRADSKTPLPLSQLAEYFGFSPVSIHEMVQKLNDRGWVLYHPYRGVTLTESGEAAALALLRRHRLWERFLADVLELPWDEAHAIAGQLEHAAPEQVTERLAVFLGDPSVCPHGGPIPPSRGPLFEYCLGSLALGAEARVTRIAPETPERLRLAAELGMVPGRYVKVRAQDDRAIEVEVFGEEGGVVQVPIDHAKAIWLELL